MLRPDVILESLGVVSTCSSVLIYRTAKCTNKGGLVSKDLRGLAQGKVSHYPSRIFPGWKGLNQHWAF